MGQPTYTGLNFKVVRDRFTPAPTPLPPPQLLNPLSGSDRWYIFRSHYSRLKEQLEIHETKSGKDSKTALLIPIMTELTRILKTFHLTIVNI